MYPKKNRRGEWPGEANAAERSVPPNHHMDSFTSFSVAFESLVLVDTDGQTAEIAFTSPGSENVMELYDTSSTIEESSPYVFQAHFGLTSEPWDLSTPTIILGPGIPE